MSTNSYAQEARRAKVEALLAAFERHAVAAAGRPLDFLNTDAAIVYALGAATIAGVKTNRHTAGCRRSKAWTEGEPCCEDHDLLPTLWHDIADDAGLPAKRHPSVTTVKALVCRLHRRAIDARRDPFEIVGAA